MVGKKFYVGRERGKVEGTMEGAREGDRKVGSGRISGGGKVNGKVKEEESVNSVQITSHGASVQLALVIFDIEVPYCGQLTAVKTRYPLASIT